MNNEDIKVLEEFIENYNASYPEEKEWVAIYPNEVQAIENLIARNKELEEKAYKKEYYEEVADELYKNSIPKSKVREKIEELNRELQLCEKQHIDTIKAYTPIDIIKAEIKRLEEIIEGDK